MDDLKSSDKVVIVAPVGQDAAAMADLLINHAIVAEICRGASEAAVAVQSGIGALLITEEALENSGAAVLWEAFEQQPPWSELPLIILTTGGESRLLKLLDAAAAAAGGVTLLERPMGGLTLLRAVETALRSRRRQYEVRDLLQKLNASMQAAEIARNDAEAATRAKDDFIAALSHELRTPLNPVLMAASELEDDHELPDTVRSRIEMIRRNVELEARLIDDLLDLTHIRHGKLKLQSVPCDAHDLLKRSAEIVQSEVGGKAHLLNFALTASQHWVQADPVRLQQVFWNVLKNALKFTPEEGQVRVQTRNPRSGLLAVSVEDTGIGLTLAARQRIFKPFDQGELEGRHQFGGLGLGLSISKAIIDAHNGALTVASEGLGKGATFTIELETCGAAPKASTKAAPPPATSEGTRILLVEDHSDTLRMVAALLTRDGHFVISAGSVKEALARAEEQPPALVISDLGLPDGTGLSLMKELKKRYGVPGIAVSGYGAPADINETKTAGFDLHLVKPMNITALRSAIAEITGRR